MPAAIPVFAKAMNLSTEELFKQMEAGKLLSADVLPKVAKELRRTANSGGALEMRMKSMRVAQGRFFKQVEASADTIFTAGFDTGGGEMFNEMADEIDKAGAGLKGLGKIFNLVFKMVGNLAQFLMPILDSVFFSIGMISDALVNIFQHKASQIAGGIGLIAFAMTGLNTQLATANTLLAGFLRQIFIVLTPILALVAAVDEVMAKFDSSRTPMSEHLEGKQFDYKDVKVRDLFRLNNLNPIQSIPNSIALGRQAYDYMTGSGASPAPTQTPVNVNVSIDGMNARMQKELSTFVEISSIEGRQ